jgi:NAD(P)-dependent dehydrogenase (short-subunit alcohol dehydrogenase family)
MGRLEGKTAVITGANSGIGLASAKRFVAEGAYVYIIGRRQEELDKAAIGTGVLAVQGDVSHLDDLDRLFSKVRSDQERIDVLSANAGLGAREPLGKITESSSHRRTGLQTRGPATAAGLNRAHRLNLQGPLCASITTGRHSDDDQT